MLRLIDLFTRPPLQSLEAAADKFAAEKYVITRPDSGPYLTRWTMVGKRFTGDGFAVFLHRFHRSDNEVPHCHPWPFVSVILAGGYWEDVPADPKVPGGPLRRRWYAPGRVLKRSAKWVHRVVLPPGREAWTLVIRGRKERSWGFYCPGGFMPWRVFQAGLDAGNLNPCG